MGSSNKTFKTLGLSIEFPFEPYGTQRAMMNKITSILTNKEHSLIESPTGTGKTLVLLCSSLAWLTKSKSIEQPFVSLKLKQKLAQERLEKLKKRNCRCGRRDVASEYDEIKAVKENDDLKKPKPFEDGAEEFTEELPSKRIKMEDTDVIEIIDDDDDDCRIEIIDDNEDCGVNDLNRGAPTKTKSVDDDQESKSGNGGANRQPCQACRAIEAEENYQSIMGADSMDGEEGSKLMTKIPKIYYGTRTHKQITQVIRELNKTSYRKNLKMCILSARERTCINQEVKDLPERNERCQELVNNRKSSGNSMRKTEIDSCPYYSESKLIAQTFEIINQEYDDRAWDIEDATKFGQKFRACPYFGVRSLQEQADITLCPYNYLLDPNIRATMQINLSNAIIIIDEAHNLEDICRDSASFVIDTKKIDDILNTINIAASHYVQGSTIMDAYQYFRDKFENLKYFMVKFNFQPADKDTYDQSEKRVLTEGELKEKLKLIGLGPDTSQRFKEHLKVLTGDDDEGDEKSTRNDDSQDSALNFGQLQYIRQLSTTLNFMYANGNKCLTDYRGVITKNLDREPHKQNHRFGRTQNPNARDDIYIWQFSLLCMNPGVAFEKVHFNAWSVIVASGTLSPIESLKSELGCKFSQPFEGGHVINSERIFASIVSHGPSRTELNCAYSNSLKLNFQDEVGFVIRDICATVPKGVLCFFPSYDRMENFCQRWMAKGIIRDIEKSKGHIFKEQKKLSASEFERILEKYNKRAKSRGALLLAVFRGKVSEGIDFADDAARAVITIGIPYPNVREVTVDLKKSYNDSARLNRPEIMPGGDWYACQAFRALNQALGRCIRHKEDWGAVIMIDSRLQALHSKKNLSKWLQNSILTTNDYNVVSKNLREFVQSRSGSVIIQECQDSNESFDDF